MNFSVVTEARRARRVHEDGVFKSNLPESPNRKLSLGTLDTNSSRKILKSPPLARHFLPMSQAVQRVCFQRLPSYRLIRVSYSIRALHPNDDCAFDFSGTSRTFAVEQI